MTIEINTNIRFYKANDPYYYEVDNLPLIDLLENDIKLAMAIDNSDALTNDYGTNQDIDNAIQSAMGPKADLNVAAGGTAVNYITAQGFAKLADLDLTSYATYSWLNAQLFINQAKLLTYGYATSSWVNSRAFASETWVTNKNYATQDWVTLKAYATEQWIIDQGYSKNAASQLSELTDTSIWTAPANRSQGDILIHNETSQKMEIGATAERTLYTEHSVFDSLTAQADIIAVASSTVSTGSVYNTAIVQYTPLSGTVHGLIEHATLSFNLTSSGTADGAIYFRKATGFKEQVILKVAGSAAEEGENFVIVKLPVTAVGTNTGQFKFQYRADTGVNVAHNISVLGVSTADTVRVIL